MIVNDNDYRNELLRSAITGWSGHGWKDGRHIADLEEYFEGVKDKIEVILAENNEKGDRT